METIIIKPKNVCSREIRVEHENGVITHVTFFGGCPGNTEGIARLLVGMRVEDAIQKLDGVMCRNGTSCPNELAKGLKEQYLK